VRGNGYGASRSDQTTDGRLTAFICRLHGATWVIFVCQVPEGSTSLECSCWLLFLTVNNQSLVSATFNWWTDGEVK
jgi:hypothetical protein